MRHAGRFARHRARWAHSLLLLLLCSEFLLCCCSCTCSCSALPHTQKKQETRINLLLSKLLALVNVAGGLFPVTHVSGERQTSVGEPMTRPLGPGCWLEKDLDRDLWYSSFEALREPMSILSAYPTNREWNLACRSARSNSCCSDGSAHNKVGYVLGMVLLSMGTRE